MQGAPVATFEIEGQTVTCHEIDGDRLWRCGCADFERRLRAYGEGFCAHTAVALMRQTSSTTPDSVKPSELP